MGYRSDVGLCLTAQANEIMAMKLAELIKRDQEKAKIVIDLINAAKICEDQDTGAKLYYWEWLKWYSDYHDVEFFESLMAQLEQELHDSYYFIRIGDSDDDIDYHGGFTDNPFGMSVVRGICFDDKGLCEPEGCQA